MAGRINIAPRQNDGLNSKGLKYQGQYKEHYKMKKERQLLEQLNENELFF